MTNGSDSALNDFQTSITPVTLSYTCEVTTLGVNLCEFGNPLIDNYAEFKGNVGRWKIRLVNKETCPPGIYEVSITAAVEESTVTKTKVFNLNIPCGRNCDLYL